MPNTIRRTSLRTRLALLAAFAIVALLVALFVAWRLARATETFALRQANSSVHAAARDLARELQANPDGYQTIEQATPGPPDRLRERGPRAPDERARRVPPHVETLFAAYSDPLARLTAITLHRFPDVEGGFYRSTDGALIGYASPQDPAASLSNNVSSDLINEVRTLASQAAASGAPAARTSQIGSDRTLLVAYPAQADGMATAWAMQRLSHLSGVSDWPNIAALVALALSILAVSGIALITVRDLRSGVTGIEAGLAGLTTDLNLPILLPETAELARIAAAINELAATLRANIARQAELEQELQQSARLSALGRVVAGVAHEVRNPLAAIKLKVQLAQRSSYAPEKLGETFSVISAEIERLDTLVRRLLELGGQQKREHGAVDLGELVSRRAAFFTDLAAHAGVVIATRDSAESLVVAGDGNRLAQVVDNIIQNALDAMPDGGRLTINCTTFKAQDGSASARLSFEDTGPGIQQADREHIFEPFHTGRDAGTGLGLAIARAIIEEHGGRISFVSRAGSGASFVIELPLPPSQEYLAAD
jgi:signal transduction histidine kinase